MNEAGANSLVGPDDPGEVRMSGVGRALMLAAIVMLTGAGLLLWAQQSDALFATYLVTAIAGCF